MTETEEIHLMSQALQHGVELDPDAPDLWLLVLAGLTEDEARAYLKLERKYSTKGETN